MNSIMENKRIQRFCWENNVVATIDLDVRKMSAEVKLSRGRIKASTEIDMLILRGAIEPILYALLSEIEKKEQAADRPKGQ